MATRYFGVIKDMEGKPVYAFVSDEGDDFYTGLTMFFDEFEPELVDETEALQTWLEKFENGREAAMEKFVLDVDGFTIVVYAVRYEDKDLF